MKNVYFLLLIIICVRIANAQEPAFLSLQGFGGDRYDGFSYVTNTADGGTIVLLNSSSNSGTGNISDACTNNHNSQNIYRKYNSDLSVLEWSKCFERTGDSTYEYIFPTADNGIVFGGSFTSTVGRGYQFTKLDANDNVVWQKNFSKGNAATLWDMIATGDGGYLVLGRSFYTDTNVLVHYGSFMNGDIWALKLDADANKEWSIVLGSSGDDWAHKVLPAPGGYYVVGTAGSNDHDCTDNHGYSDLFVARLDYDGNIIWKHCYGGSLPDGAGLKGSASEDGKGGLIVAGSSNSGDGDVNGHISQGGYDTWILNIDSNGQLVWSNCYGGSGQEYEQRICRAADGSIWATARINKTGGQIAATYGGEDIWVLHLGSDGAYLGSKVLGSIYSDFATMLHPLPDNTVLVGGSYSKGDGTFSGLSKYDTNGSDAFLAVFAPWTTGIKEQKTVLNAVSFYPNPAEGILHISLNNPDYSGKCKVTITDASGRQVLRKTITTAETIPVQNWARGIYTVQVSGKDGLRYAEKIILQ